MGRTVPWTSHDSDVQASGQMASETPTSPRMAATGESSSSYREQKQQQLHLLPHKGTSGSTASGLHVSSHTHHRSSHEREKAVTIRLRTRKDDLDEKAEVKVAVHNPDRVVENMLTTLAHQFPPESVVTISTNNQQSSDNTSTSEDTASSRCTKETAGGVTSFSRPSGKRRPHALSGRHYLALDGGNYAEICDSKGRPAFGYARDPETGKTLPVGREVIGKDGRAVPNMIVGPNGQPIPGLPVPREGLDAHLRPVIWYKTDGVNSMNSRQQSGHSRSSRQDRQADRTLAHHGEVSEQHQRHAKLAGSNESQLFNYVSQHGTHVVDDTSVQISFGFAKDVSPNRVKVMGFHSHYDAQEQTVISSSPGERQRVGGKDGSISSVKAQYATQQSLLTSDSYQSKASSHQKGHKVSTPNPGTSAPNCPNVTVKIPAPSYPLLDGSYAQLAVGLDGRPLDAQGQDPKTGLILPVGRPFYDANGNLVSDGLILGPEGEGVPGMQLAFHGWDADSQQPLPYYLTIDNQWVAMYIDEGNRLVHGLARDYKTNQVKPVGLQAMDFYGRPLRDTIIGPDGRTTRGIPLSVAEDDTMTTASSPRNPISLLTTTNSTNKAVTSYLPVTNTTTTTTNYVSGGSTLQSRPIGGSNIPSNIPSKIPSNLPTNYMKAGSHFTPPSPRVSLPNTSGYFLGNHTAMASNQASVNRREMETDRTMVEGPDEDGEMVRYVEVPIIEEKIIHVPKREIRHIDKRVPKYEVVEVIKNVEVPHIQYVDRHVEVPQIQTIVKEVKVRQVVDRPFEVLIHQPRIETKLVEHIREVPGDIIEVPRVERQEVPVYVPRYIDKEIPTVIAQQLRPFIRQVSDLHPVPYTVTQPKIINVNIFIPKPVVSTLGLGRKIRETHQTVDIPAAQFNALTRRLNVALDLQHIESLYVRDGPYVPILPAGERVETVEPMTTEWTANHQRGKIHCRGAVSLPQLAIQETLGLAQPERLRGIEDNETCATDAYSFSEPRHDDELSVECPPPHHQRRHDRQRHHRRRHEGLPELCRQHRDSNQHRHRTPASGSSKHHHKRRVPTSIGYNLS